MAVEVEVAAAVVDDDEEEARLRPPIAPLAGIGVLTRVFDDDDANDSAIGVESSRDPATASTKSLVGRRILSRRFGSA